MPLQKFGSDLKIWRGAWTLRRSHREKTPPKRGFELRVGGRARHWSTRSNSDAKLWRCPPGRQRTDGGRGSRETGELMSCGRLIVGPPGRPSPASLQLLAAGLLSVLFIGKRNSLGHFPPPLIGVLTPRTPHHLRHPRQEARCGVGRHPAARKCKRRYTGSPHEAATSRTSGFRVRGGSGLPIYLAGR